MRGDDDDEIQRGPRTRPRCVNGGRRPRGPFETAVEAARAVSLILVATLRHSNFSRNCISYFCKKEKKGMRRPPPPRVSESIIGRESIPPLKSRESARPMISWVNSTCREIPKLLFHKASTSVIRFSLPRIRPVPQHDYRFYFASAIIVTFLRAASIAIGTASRSNQQMSGDIRDVE